MKEKTNYQTAMDLLKGLEALLQDINDVENNDEEINSTDDEY